jgi:hypothetical protein
MVRVEGSTHPTLLRPAPQVTFAFDRGRRSETAGFRCRKLKTMKVLPPLELQRVFATEAANLIQARQSAITVHHTKDIDAAGDEVEQPARDWLAAKLGLSYHIGHGHILDSRLIVSPQLDTVVVSNDRTPVLLRTENGTEYLPYESVYAIGEVKSSYRKSRRYVQGFTDVLHTIRNQLTRQRTPQNYLGHGVTLDTTFQLKGVSTPYRNPLFSFMLFFDKGDFEWEDVAPHYVATPTLDLPNVVCILNEGVIVNTRIDRVNRKLLSINVCPEFNQVDSDSESNRSSKIALGTDFERPGYALASLFFMLCAHIAGCVLMPPNLQDYLNRIFVNVPKTCAIAW